MTTIHRAHVGLAPYIAADGKRHSSFQLVNAAGSAVANIDFSGGGISRETVADSVPIDVAVEFREWAGEQDATLPVTTFTGRPHSVNTP